MQSSEINLIILLVATTLIILLLAAMIITLIYNYQKRQLRHIQNVNNLKLSHEKHLLSSQLAIQESTFQHISREIHDNINLSLTLAKLKLNTLNLVENQTCFYPVRSSVDLIGKAIDNLSDISRSLNSDIIVSQGLVTALENEIKKINDLGLLTVKLEISGNSVFMSLQKELITFRIMQEAFNNILKHSAASDAQVLLHYNDANLEIAISDNGKGFIAPDLNEVNKAGRAGLKNMDARTKAIEGNMQIDTSPGHGTKLLFYIPY